MSDPERPIRATYATTFDPDDIRKWSGLVHYIGQAVRQQGVELHNTGQLASLLKMFNIAKGRLRKAWKKGPFPVERTLAYAKACANEINDHVRRNGTDLVLAPSSIPVALFQGNVPSMLYSDATFSVVLQQYPEMSKYPSRFLQEGMELEHAAMANAQALVFSSAWAARSAVKDHGADPNKVHVIPFGSNLTVQVSSERVHRAIEERSKECCELLFMAVRWRSKGGDMVLRIAEELKNKGVPVHLTLVGCPAPYKDMPSHIEQVGYINKNTGTGQRKLIDLMLRSHFMVLPTRIDCTPVVFSECASMGVPCLSSKGVGGISEIIRSGINGATFGLHDIDGYVNFIAEHWNDPRRYEALASSSLDEYTTRLNWGTSGAALRLVMSDLLGDNSTQLGQFYEQVDQAV